jgi:hypothetical protein
MGMLVLLNTSGLVAQEAGSTDESARPASAAAPAMVSTVVVNTATGEVPLTGRVVATSADSLLLESADGKLESIPAKGIVSQTQSSVVFRYLTTEELAAQLLEANGGSFEIHSTPHYVICSNAAPEYARFVADLLEKVHDEYLDFFRKMQIPVTEPVMPLPVVIFKNPAMFSEFARKQHPEVSFEDVPGYYSVKYNQMLLTDGTLDDQISNRREVLSHFRDDLRTIETIVHESIHQLAFNTGLHVRYADNPLWLLEGLATYFEGASGRGSLLWGPPGQVSRIHHARLATTLGDNDALGLSLSVLLQSNEAFQSSDQLADAYAESWLLTHYLVKRNSKAFRDISLALQTHEPLTAISSDARLTQVTEASGMPVAELEAELTRYAQRLRAPR